MNLLVQLVNCRTRSMTAKLCQGFPDITQHRQYQQKSPLKGKASNCLKNQPLGTMPLKLKSFSKDKSQFQIPFWKRIKQTGYLDENGW